MSQNDQILSYLKQGHTITPMDALDKFRCFRLAARINDLRDMGFSIQSRKVKANGKHFAEYRMA